MALVGIARLASQSELLEAKRQVDYLEIPARSILNRTKPNMPFRWTINPYRGCEFGCKYCYARYTHEFMELDAHEFEDRIYAKAASAHLLRQELRRIPREDRIALGTATDPYQPAERRYLRTRAILEVFAAERGRHLGIISKSDLIVRDLDLLREIARGNVLGVSLTITTLDEKLARLLEPRAPRPALRLEAVSRLAAAGIQVGVMPNPVMPGITDGERSLDRLAKAARDAGAVSFGGGPLFLMPSAQKVFLPFLETRIPAPGGAVPPTVRPLGLPGPRLQGRATDQSAARPRPLRPGFHRRRLQAGTVAGRGAGGTVSVTVKVWNSPNSTIPCPMSGSRSSRSRTAPAPGCWWSTAPTAIGRTAHSGSSPPSSLPATAWPSTTRAFSRRACSATAPASVPFPSAGTIPSAAST